MSPEMRVADLVLTDRRPALRPHIADLEGEDARFPPNYPEIPPLKLRLA